MKKRHRAPNDAKNLRSVAVTSPAPAPDEPTRALPTPVIAGSQPSGHEESRIVVKAPGPRGRQIISVAIVLHLIATGASLMATVEPSAMHAGLVDQLSPYLQLTHFGGDEQRFYFAHGGKNEQAHRIEWSESATPSESEWLPWAADVAPGLAESDRLARFLVRAAELADDDQSSLVATMLLPIAQRQPTMRSLRIVRLPTQLTTIIDDAAPPPYVARVVREPATVHDSNELAIKFVRLQSPRLVTTSTSFGPDKK